MIVLVMESQGDETD